ncbi:hypothetical protein DH2020_001730 [Rehmannia glutinosa]|uniref:Uncharacterized protein n=1 Tax=Rehmannia glutinosa TaxID=99300 RepID=A0ABR0XRY1_REHGL
MEETPNPTQPGNISGKIISIAAGEAHTLALTGDGKVYSWGRGTFGRLGTGSEEDRHLPVRVSFFGSDDEREDELKIVGIAAGAYHSLALADSEDCVMMDQSGAGVTTSIQVFLDPNTDGQIGVTGENHLIPHLLEGFFGLGSPGSSTQDDEMKSGKQLKISSVIAGGMMSLAIDNHGALWMWGNCPHPSENNSLKDNFRSAGETYNGSDLICYSWGGNNYGQLAWPWDHAKFSSPEIVRELPKSIFLVSVDCGLFHTSVASPDGEVWSWGMEKGLGLCPDARFTGTDSRDDFKVNELNNEYSKENNSRKYGNGEKIICGDGGDETPSIESFHNGKIRWHTTRLDFWEAFQEREIPASLKNSGTFDIAKEWENMLESLDQRNLARLEMFYRDMRAGVKDKLLKRRVQEMVKECLNSNATTE